MLAMGEPSGKAIGFNPAVDDSVRVRALTQVAEFELKRQIASKRKSGKIR
jgi:hypothetical protein